MQENLVNPATQTSCVSMRNLIHLIHSFISRLSQSPQLSHDDTHSRIEQYASRYASNPSAIISASHTHHVLPILMTWCEWCIFNGEMLHHEMSNLPLFLRIFIIHH